MTQWKYICKLEDIPVLGARRVTRAQGLDRRRGIGRHHWGRGRSAVQRAATHGLTPGW